MESKKETEKKEKKKLIPLGLVGILTISLFA